MMSEPYIQFCCWWMLIQGVGYLGYIIVSLSTHKINRLAFQAAIICEVVIVADLVRLVSILRGSLPPVYKPPLVWLVMNLPFWVFLYEIFLRKLVLTIYKKVWTPN
jgi:hypothetical protein